MGAPAVETVLFDLDGTLIDSIELIYSSYRHTLRVHRDLQPPDAVWLQGLGTPLAAQFRMFTDDPAEIESMIATYREHNALHHDAGVQAYPGAVETVDELRRRGLRLGVVTSKKRATTARGLEVCGLAGRFEVLVCSDDLERHKPDPGPVLHALEGLGARAGGAVFVGDSPHDLVAGRGAGVRTAAACWGPFPRAELEAHAPDYWLGEPAALLALV